MIAGLKPDVDRDVIVRHTRQRDADTGVEQDRWLICLGSAQRGGTEDPQGAFVFARLLADLVKRPIWIVHGPDDFQRLDPASIRGCSCC